MPMPSNQGGDGVDKVVPICALLASLIRRCKIKGQIREHVDENRRGTIDMPRGTAGPFNQHPKRQCDAQCMLYPGHLARCMILPTTKTNVTVLSPTTPYIQLRSLPKRIHHFLPLPLCSWIRNGYSHRFIIYRLSRYQMSIFLFSW